MVMVMVIVPLSPMVVEFLHGLILMMITKKNCENVLVMWSSVASYPLTRYPSSWSFYEQIRQLNLPIECLFIVEYNEEKYVLNKVMRLIGVYVNDDFKDMLWVVVW